MMKGIIKRHRDIQLRPHSGEKLRKKNHGCRNKPTAQKSIVTSEGAGLDYGQKPEDVLYGSGIAHAGHLESRLAMCCNSSAAIGCVTSDAHHVSS
jgi:hypothetical protein